MHFTRKFIGALVIVALIAPAVQVFAVDEPPFPSSVGNGGATYNNPLLPPPSGGSYSTFSVDTSGIANSQGSNVVNNVGFDSSQQNVAGGLVQAGGSCAFNSMLSEMLSDFISYLLESLLSDAAEEEAVGLLRVPIQTDMGTSGAQKAQRAKDVCAWAPFGYCLIPSLDAIAYCFVNEIIRYIGQATIEWIKTGFKGSPAFVDDPGRFFTNAVDSVAGTLLNQISDGLLCEPWRAQVQIRLLNEHVGNWRNGGAQGCRLSEVSDRWEEFAAGGNFFSWNLQYAYTQNPYNNPLGSYIEARNAFNVQLAQVQNGLQVELGWSDGFIHVKDPETGRITTPGRVLENQINRRLGNAENRLLIADEFDEIINTLVNELVKLALSEVFDGGSGNSSDDRISGTYSRGGGYQNGGTDQGDPNQGGGDSANDVVLDPDGGTDGIGSDLSVTCSVDNANPDEGETVTVRANVTGSVGRVSYDWDGDFTGFASTSSRTFDTTGGYTARLIVTDEDWDGQVARVTCPRIRVSEDFAVSCTVSDTLIAPGDRVTYTATVTGADGRIVDYDWSGAATGRGDTISKRYTSVGVYNVSVDVADATGNRQLDACPSVTVRSGGDGPNPNI